MSRRPNYNLPTLGLENTPTVHQIRPHEGFTPEAITLRAPFTLVSETDLPDPVLGTPAAWTTQASCLGDLRFAEDDGLEALKPTCRACPVKDICLSTALEEERWANGSPLEGSERTGIRGGLTPRERTHATIPRPASCKAGHRMTDDTSRLNWQRGTWVCKTCVNARKRERRAEGEAA